MVCSPSQPLYRRRATAPICHQGLASRIPNSSVESGHDHTSADMTKVDISVLLVFGYLQLTASKVRLCSSDLPCHG